MDGVNKPGVNPPAPPADDNEDNESISKEPEHRPQTAIGERPKGKSLAERMKANKDGITTVNDGGPSVRPATPPPPAESDGEAGNN